MNDLSSSSMPGFTDCGATVRISSSSGNPACTQTNCSSSMYSGSASSLSIVSQSSGLPSYGANQERRLSSTSSKSSGERRIIDQ